MRLRTFWSTEIDNAKKRCRSEDSLRGAAASNTEDIVSHHLLREFGDSEM